MKLAVIGLFAGVALAASLVETKAPACSPAGCAAPDLVPSAGARVPGNLPGFLFIPARSQAAGGGSGGGRYGPELRVIELFDATGTPVPATLNESVLAPHAPLASGTYTLRFRECGPDTSTLPKEQSVEVVAPAPLPTTAGTLRVTLAKEPVRVWTSAGSCTVDRESSIARLAVDASDALTPWLPLVRWTVTVDHDAWTGPYRKDGTFSLISLDASDPLTLFTICEDAGRNADSGLLPGPHHVAVTGKIVGAAQPLPALETDITLTCPGGPTPSSAPSDSGCNAANASPGEGAPFASVTLAFGVLFVSRRRSRGAAGTVLGRS